MTRAISSIGDRIRKARTDAGLTQAQLGEAVGVSRAAVAQWESGDTKSLSSENIFRAGRALRKSPEWLVTGLENERQTENLFDILADLPTNDQQQILDYMQYRIDKTEGLIASDKMAHYTAMIEDFKRDLKKRKARDNGSDKKG